MTQSLSRNKIFRDKSQSAAERREITPFVLLSVATFSRFIANTAKRIIYPFAPAIARGLGVELSSITFIIALNQSASLLAPTAVSLGDKFGHKLLLIFSFALLTIGMFATGFIPLYPVVMISLFLTGFAKSILDPTFQAIAGNLVPFEKRGMAIGIMEMAWAASTLIGVPLAGIIIETYNWQAPFVIIGVLSLICFFIILKIIPSTPPRRKKTRRSPLLLENWKTILKDKQVAAMLIFIFFICLANDNLFVIYGVWLEDSFHLSLAVIGLGTLVIGLSEILGELLTAFLSDKIGLKKSLALGTCLSGLSFFFLVFLNTSLSLVLTGFFIVFLTFEFSVVTSMSLCTELIPGARASVMSAYYASAGLGRVVGAVSAGILWKNSGIFAVCMVSSVCTFFALMAIVIGLRKFKKPDGGLLMGKITNNLD